MHQDRERLLAGEATPTGSSHTKSNLSAYTSDKPSGLKGTLVFNNYIDRIITISLVLLK